MLNNSLDIFENLIKPALFEGKENSKAFDKTAFYVDSLNRKFSSSFPKEILSHQQLKNSSIILSSEELKEYLPQSQILENDKITTTKNSLKEKEIIKDWIRLAEKEAQEKGLNIVYVTKLGANSIKAITEHIKVNKSADYRVELHVLGLNKNESKMDTYQSYANDKTKDIAVLNFNVLKQENEFQNLPKNLKILLEKGTDVDTFVVYQRASNLNKSHENEHKVFEKIFESSEKTEFKQGLKTLIEAVNQPLNEIQKMFYGSVFDKLEKEMGGGNTVVMGK